MSKTAKGCACTQYLRDLLRAYAPKKNPLRKTVCSTCGTLFWTDSEREYCFDCETKKEK